MPRYYTVKEIAKLERKTEDTVRRWITEQPSRLEAIWSVSAWRIPAESYERFRATQSLEAARRLAL